MSKKIDVCVNHPDRYTSRHCFYCHKPICSDCQKIYSHHIFCSRLCWYRFLFREKPRLFLKKLRPVFGRLTRHQLLFLWLTIWILFSILLVQNFRLNRAVRSLSALQLPSSAGGNPKRPAQPLPAASVRIRKPVPGAMIFSNDIRVKGEAKDGWILVLEDTTGPLAVTLPRNGQFEFPVVSLSRKTKRLRVKAFAPDGKMLALEELTVRFAPPNLRYLATPIRRGSLAEKKVALTFDGGASNNVTGEILDILRSRNVHCTMFLTGQFLRHYPETVRQIVHDGHEVGNHTFDHPHLTTYAENHRHVTRPGVTRAFVQEELKKTAELFHRITGKSMAPLWRPPYGESNAQIRQWAAETGFQEVDWTIGHDRQENMDTRDWIAQPDAPGYLTGEEIEKKILAFARHGKVGANGAIILMHLGSNRRTDFPHKRLPALIDSLRNEGYRFVKISDLLP